MKKKKREKKKNWIQNVTDSSKWTNYFTQSETCLWGTFLVIFRLRIKSNFYVERFAFQLSYDANVTANLMRQSNCSTGIIVLSSAEVADFAYEKSSAWHKAFAKRFHDHE